MGICAICEGQTLSSLEFCNKCFRTHREDIQDKKPWVRTVKNAAQKERRRRIKE
jgi:hypothetical protein